MRNTDTSKVVFYSREDMSSGYNLQKGEHILQAATKENHTDINEVLELYNLKLFLDNDLYLKSWSNEDIAIFKAKAVEYGKTVGQFMASINDSNIIGLYEDIIFNYVHSFWELFNNQSLYKKISNEIFYSILTNDVHLIHEILKHKKIVDYYENEIKLFLLTYSQSAEILLSVYETQTNFSKSSKYIPKSLTIQEKETIISNYLDSDDVNLNYTELIQNARNKSDFKVSDKLRLKAKRLHKNKVEEIFAEKSGMEYGVSIRFPKNATTIKDGHVDDNFVVNYTYSLDFITQNNDPYSLFKNFIILFEYLDEQGRINLVSRKSQMNIFERIMGVRSQNQYRASTTFNLSEMTSHIQIAAYSKILADLNLTLESILQHIFTISFQDKYLFSGNARFSIPSATTYFEKVRLLAPEFESVLKQFKLFVEDGAIDFDLLQISSTPSSIKDIPSLNQNKYIYLNESNNEVVYCINLLFSDQTTLTYIEPFKEKKYSTFFDLLASEKVKFSNYEEYQKPEMNYLISKHFITVDDNGFVQIVNTNRVTILKDLFSNEVASFYYYSSELKQEAQQMATEGLILFDSSLFSKPEQAYFNYFLNKSEFTNGLDLRNSYLHGTQAAPNETEKHENSYFTYLKLVFLAMLKIENDLSISKTKKTALTFSNH